MELVSTNQHTPFPDEFCDPALKEKPEWLRQYARAAYHSANNLPEGAIGVRSRPLYQKIRRYAHGKQDWRDYLIAARLLGEKDPYVISWLDRKVVPLGPKHAFIGTGLITKQQRKTSINAIDPLAPNALKKQQAERKARLLFRKEMERQGLPDMAAHPEVARRPGEPDDEEGLEIMAMGERLPICAEAQDIVNGIKNYNNWEAIRYQWAQSLFYYGFGAVKDDTEGGGVCARVCNPDDLVASYSKYWDFRDMTHCGEIRTISVSALAAMSSGQVKEEELKALYKQGQMSDWYAAGQYNGDGDWYGRATVQVLELEVLSTDLRRSVEFKDRNGNLKYIRGKKKKAEDKEIETRIQNVYRVKWVIGTDIVFDCGKQVNIKRDNASKAKARLSYHILAGSIDEMVPYSRMRALMDLIDEYVTLTVKMRNAVYKMKQSTWDVNLDALEDVNLGNGKNALTPREILTNWEQNGVIVSRSRSLNGQIKSEKPAVSFIQAGVGNEIAVFTNRRLEIRQEINDVIGYNPATDATTIDPKTLNGASSAMLEGTNNALTDLFFADKQLTKQTTESLLIRAQALIRSGKGQDLMGIVGADTVQRIGDAPPLDKYNFGITIEDAPSPEEMNDFRNSLNIALERGQIKSGQRTIALQMAKDNLLQAQLYLEYAEKKTAKEAQDLEMQRINANAQQQQQSAQAAEQAKQQTIGVQLQADLQRYDRQHEHAMELKAADGGIILERERIGETGREEAARIQAIGRQDANVRDNMGKLIKEGLGNHAGAISQRTDLTSKVTPLTSAEQPALPPPAFSFLAAQGQQEEQQEPTEQPEEALDL